MEAEQLGASRLELVSGMSEGGLTPSYGTIKEVLKSNLTIPVYVLIRPHSYSYFYDESEMNVILEDIKQVISLGGNRIVFGALNKDKTINEDALKKIIELNPNIIITFNGAIDFSDSVIDSYKVLTKYKKNVQYLVTIGGKSTAVDGAEMLTKLVKLQRDKDGPIVMPAKGLRVNNISKLHQTINSDYYHFGKGVRKDNEFYNGFDSQKINKIKTLLNIKNK